MRSSITKKITTSLAIFAATGTLLAAPFSQDALRGIPQKYEAFGYIDVDAVRKNFYWKELKKLDAAKTDEKKELSKKIFDFLEKVSDISIVQFASENAEKPAIISTRGSFTEKEYEKLFPVLMGNIYNARGEKVKIDGKTFFVVKDVSTENLPAEMQNSVDLGSMNSATVFAQDGNIFTCVSQTNADKDFAMNTLKKCVSDFKKGKFSTAPKKLSVPEGASELFFCVINKPLLSELDDSLDGEVDKIKISLYETAGADSEIFVKGAVIFTDEISAKTNAEKLQQLAAMTAMVLAMARQAENQEYKKHLIEFLTSMKISSNKKTMTIFSKIPKIDHSDKM